MRILNRTAVLGVVASATLLGGCVGDGYGPSSGYAPARGYAAYDYDRPDPAYNGYDAGRYYHQGRRDRQVAANERVYRGNDGRYYCRHSDGTTGLIVGAAAGGLLGAVIAPGGSGLLGALIGGGVGAVAGQSIDRNKVRCR